MKSKISKPAFSLTELSVVMLIVSVVLVGFLSVYTSSNVSSKAKITNDRISDIDKALRIYIARNKKLPCPAAINVTKNDPNYGTAGSCVAGSGFYTSGTLVYGMVPFKELNLSLYSSEDAYGGKFAYIVDSTFATIATPSNFSDTANKQGAIVVNRYDSLSSSLSALEPNAIFAIVSYGPNGKGAISGVSNSVLDVSTDPDEIDNGSASFNATLTANTTRANSSFDDVVFYRNKKNFLLDSKMQESIGRSNMTGFANVKPAADCSASGIAGIADGTVLLMGASLTKNCNAANFDTTKSITYTCDSSVVSAITNNCTCNSGYQLSGLACNPITCTTAAGTGYLAQSSLAYTPSGSGTFACNTAAGYTIGTVTYTCNASGAATAVSGTCSMEPCTYTGGGNTDTTTVPGAFIHRFGSNGTLTCPSARTIKILVVGGGGGGGAHDSGGGGGGGGGVVVHENLQIAAGKYDIAVGGGGGPSSTTKSAKNGANSSFKNNIATTPTLVIQAAGGGAGGGNVSTPYAGVTSGYKYLSAGSPGGSCGGCGRDAGNVDNGTMYAAICSAVVANTISVPGGNSYGNRGGTTGNGWSGGGGGGGALAVGGNGGGDGVSQYNEKAGKGGDGIEITLFGGSGSPYYGYYGAGGGGGNSGNNTAGNVGVGGSKGKTGAGGDGGAAGLTDGGSGVNGYGSGAGGSASGKSGGYGGSGVVIIRY